MNKAIIMGRLTRDPEVRYSQGDNSTCIARYTLAVDRRKAPDGTQSADFIPCVAFGKAGEFAEKYLKKGMRICISGRIQTGSYTNKDGVKIYTTDVIIEEQEFAESKSSGNREARNEYDDQLAAGMAGSRQQPYGDLPVTDGFINVPDGIEEELPFT